MKTLLALLEIITVYVAAVLLNYFISWLLESEYTEAGTVKVMLLWYVIQWIEYRRSLPEKQDQSRNDQKG